jgi:hypothetical protein
MVSMPRGGRIFIAVGNGEAGVGQKGERDGGEKLVNSDTLVFKPIYQQCERNQEEKNGN